MATATTKSFDVISLDGIEPGPEHDGRVPLNIRRHFDIRGFGVRANRAVGNGHVVGEHDEVGLGSTRQEELYLVLSGSATFNVDGERVDAPAGTLAHVRIPRPSEVPSPRRPVRRCSRSAGLPASRFASLPARR